MKVWLVTIGEPVPIDDANNERLHRTGYFARFLADYGHDVIWWTSTFDHFRKRHLFEADTFLSINERLQIKLLHGCGYRTNVSFSRIRDHRQIANKFSKLIRKSENKPDIIVSALPTIELCLESVKYTKEVGIPVVLDMRDMWPDIFIDSAPMPVRPLARLLLSSMFDNAKIACSGASAITGITEAFVEWGLNCGRRQRTNLDRSFPMGYRSDPPPIKKILEAGKFWDSQGIPANSNDLNVCFFGTLGKQFDLDMVIRAAKVLNEQKKTVHFVICGTGERLHYYQQLSANLPNIIFPGWVDAAAIYVLMRRSSVGIDPLPQRYDFLATINNKAIEYMSAGLPIVSSPGRGVLYELLAKEHCGLSYDCGDMEGLANILSRLCEDRTIVNSMAANSKRAFLEKFTAEKVYGEMMGYLENVVATYKNM